MTGTQKAFAIVGGVVLAGAIGYGIYRAVKKGGNNTTKIDAMVKKSLDKGQDVFDAPDMDSLKKALGTLSSAEIEKLSGLLDKAEKDLTPSDKKDAETIINKYKVVYKKLLKK